MRNEVSALRTLAATEQPRGHEGGHDHQGRPKIAYSCFFDERIDEGFGLIFEAIVRLRAVCGLEATGQCFGKLEAEPPRLASGAQ